MHQSNYNQNRITSVNLKPIRKLLLLVIILLFTTVGCEKNNSDKIYIESGYYKGTIDTNDDFIKDRDSVYLEISKGYYSCNTNIPYNYGAGKVETTESAINFMDTLFFPIPALYAAGLALSREYSYQYDGKYLILEKFTESSHLAYTLIKEK